MQDTLDDFRVHPHRQTFQDVLFLVLGRFPPKLNTRLTQVKSRVCWVSLEHLQMKRTHTPSSFCVFGCFFFYLSSFFHTLRGLCNSSSVVGSGNALSATNCCLSGLSPSFRSGLAPSETDDGILKPNEK